MRAKCGGRGWAGPVNAPIQHSAENTWDFRCLWKAAKELHSLSLQDSIPEPSCRVWEQQGCNSAGMQITIHPLASGVLKWRPVYSVNTFTGPTRMFVFHQSTTMWARLCTLKSETSKHLLSATFIFCLLPSSSKGQQPRFRYLEIPSILVQIHFTSCRCCNQPPAKKQCAEKRKANPEYEKEKTNRKWQDSRKWAASGEECWWLANIEAKGGSGDHRTSLDV